MVYAMSTSGKLPGSEPANALVAIEDIRSVIDETRQITQIHVCDREDKVVRDENGLVHSAVHSDRNSETPFIVAMCEVFDEIDKAFSAANPESFGMPQRRWPVDQETEGVVTCLQCIGI